MIVVESTYLTCTAGSSNKWYKVELTKTDDSEPLYTVNFAYGPMGTTRASGTKTPVALPLEKAQKKYQSLIRSKLNKSNPYEINTSNSEEIGVTVVTQPYNERAEAVTIQTAGADRAIAIHTAPEKVQTGIRCQLLTPIEKEDVSRYIADPNWGAQEKFDGVRKMYRREKNSLTPINRKGFVVGCPPIISQEIKDIVHARCYTLDGEEIGSTFHLFDVIGVLGDSGYLQRHQLLSLLMGIYKGKAVKLVPLAKTKREKRELYNKLRSEGKEGIVFKRLDARYQGGRNLDQVKFKFYDTASCIVEAVNTKSSIKIKLLKETRVHGQVTFDSSNFVSVGNCTIPTGHAKPSVGDIVEIKYLYAYKGGSLYQPSYKGVRDDIDLDACVLSQLKYKYEEKQAPRVPVKKKEIRKINWK